MAAVTTGAGVTIIGTIVTGAGITAITVGITITGIAIGEPASRQASVNLSRHHLT
ncbi:hypothetical protein BRAS3843_3420013 [Bradyrhizobium sp. STM 3843]|nr:hypothetical protein BRAS3843_3420013 [Bradyrhizobium sp. STM 3843]